MGRPKDMTKGFKSRWVYELIEEVAQEYGMTTEALETMYDYCFYQAAQRIAKGKGQRVALYNLGTFTPCLIRTNSIARRVLDLYKNKAIDRDRAKARLEVAFRYRSIIRDDRKLTPKRLEILKNRYVRPRKRSGDEFKAPEDITGG